MEEFTINGKVNESLVKDDLADGLFDIIQDMVLHRRGFNFEFKVEEGKEVK